MRWLLLLLLVSESYSFNPYNVVPRRVFIIGSSVICSRQQVNAQQIDNSPLTAAELQEYERLLKEAKRIQAIIDVNIKAANRTLEDDLFNLKK